MPSNDIKSNINYNSRLTSFLINEGFENGILLRNLKGVALKARCYARSLLKVKKTML